MVILVCYYNNTYVLLIYNNTYTVIYNNSDILIQMNRKLSKMIRALLNKHYD